MGSSEQPNEPKQTEQNGDHVARLFQVVEKSTYSERSSFGEPQGGRSHVSSKGEQGYDIRND
jgi:hypothetical protein